MEIQVKQLVLAIKTIAEEKNLPTDSSAGFGQELPQKCSNLMSGFDSSRDDRERSCFDHEGKNDGSSVQKQ